MQTQTAETTHNHSIVVLKDGFHPHPDRYLVYEDTRWKCKLFLNYKTNENNESLIIQHLSNELKIDPRQIHLKVLGRRVHEKYSVSDERNKVYCHAFYLAELDSYPEQLQAESFKIDGREYIWMTMQELESDEMVQQKNMDIVGFVKELC